MPRFYQHQQDLTYYTKVYKGGIATYQIAPRGADWLKSKGYRLDDEIWSWDMQHLWAMGWLYTKGEMPGMGFIDGYPDPLSPPGRSGSKWFVKRDGTFLETRAPLIRWLSEIEGVLNRELARVSNAGVLKARLAVTSLLQAVERDTHSGTRLLTSVDQMIPQLYLAAKSMSVQGLSELRKIVYEIPELPCTWRELERAEKIADSSRAMVAHYAKRISELGSVPDQLDRRVLAAVIYDDASMQNLTTIAPLIADFVPNPSENLNARVHAPGQPVLATDPPPPASAPAKSTGLDSREPARQLNSWSAREESRKKVASDPVPNRREVDAFPASSRPQPQLPDSTGSTVSPNAPDRSRDGKPPAWVIAFAIMFLLCAVINALT